MTLNQIIERVKGIALNHKQIRAFHYGSANDFFDTDQGKNFAVCILQDSGASTSNNILSVSFVIFLLDLVHISEDTRNNEQDVQSDMLQIANDLFAEFDYSIYDDWRVTQDNSIQLVREEQPDYVAGVALSISIETPNIKDVCAVPNINSITPTPPAEDFVRIVDQFGTTVAEVTPPDFYQVTRFDTLDLSGWNNPDLIITSQDTLQ